MKNNLFKSLLLVLIATALPQIASAHDFEVGGIYYYINGNNATVTYRGMYSSSYSNEYTGAVNIPSTVTYNGTTYSVTSIGSDAFNNCTDLTSVTIPNSVTSIGSSAFSYCTGLTSVTIPNSVTSIGYRAFYCSGLTSVTIGTSVTEIGGYAFSNCNGITSLTWNAVNCPSNGYMATGNIEQLSIGNAVQILPDNFVSSSKITSVTIPNSVTSIGSSAFRNCTGLVSVTIPNSVTSIGDYTFSGCTGLTSVTIPNSVTSIGDAAFSGCSGLTSVTIPNSVTTIGDDAFSGCSGLTSVTIPNSVTSIGSNAFDGTAWYNNQPDGLVYAGMIAYKYKGTMPNGTSIVLMDGCTGIAGNAFYGCSGLTSVTIPNSVTTIGAGSFYGCSGLSSVNIPNSVVTIGGNIYWNSDSLIYNGAFSNCTGLTSITIPNSVTEFGQAVFRGCSNLTSVTWNMINCRDFYYDTGNLPPFSDLTGIKTFIIGDDVEHIPAYLCNGLTGLTSVTIGNSVTSIGNSAFYGCPNLTSVTWNANNCSDFTSSTAPFININDFTFGNEVERIPAYLCRSLTGLTSVTIPNSVTEIGGYAFSNCNGITSLTWNAVNCPSNGDMATGNIEQLSIGNAVQILPDNFVSSSKITSVTIPNSVTSIGSSAFSYCTGLTSVTIPNSVTTISYDAFYGCTGLTSVTIPNSVTSIGGYAFYGCTGLTSVTIPNSVTEIGGCAFYNCSGLTSLSIGNSVTSIGSSAFYNCNGLTSVTIPNSVTKIGNSAFYNCSGLTSLSIGNSVTSIGNSAFRFCSGLNSLTIPKYVTSIGGNAFSGCSGITILKWNADSCTSNGNLSTNNIEQVMIGDNVRFLPSNFVNGSIITTLTIPRSVTWIGSSAFNNCTNLTSIVVENGNTIFDSRNYCNAIIETGANTLIYGCNSTIIPNSVTAIANNALAGYINLTSIDIPNTVTEIGNNAFSGCTGLTSVTIPNSVTTIGQNAFVNCSELDTAIWNAKNCNAYFSKGSYNRATSIFGNNTADVALPNIKTFIFGKDVQVIPDGLCYHLNPDEIYVSRQGRPVAIPSNDVFFNVDKDSCTLYVPAEYEQIYWASFGWSSFLNIVPWNPTSEIAAGDANEDGAVNIGDYVSTASYILERNPQPFNFEAADIDGNGTINVVDLVCVADIALNYLPSTSQAPATVMSDAAISMDAQIKKHNDDCYDVIINLSNDLNITAMQMDLTLPSSMALIDASLSDRADASHQVEFELLSNGDYRLLASSSANKAFSSNDGTLLTLTLAGTPSGNSVLRNIILASPENTGYELDDITLNFETTSVDEINSITKIYCDGENIIIDSTVCGSAQIVLPNGMSQTVKVQAGHNVYPAPAKGLVIVKMNDNAVKLFR